MHHLVIIGGNPGSGKTAISALLEKRGFTPLRIDDFYQEAARDPPSGEISRAGFSHSKKSDLSQGRIFVGWPTGDLTSLAPFTPTGTFGFP